MKKGIRIIIVLICLCFSMGTPIKAQEAFTIEDVNITMKVHEDGKIEVVESYKLDFTSYRHGFYRNIPSLYHMKWTIDEEVINKDYYFPITDVECSTQCEIDGNSEGMRVKLGDPDRNVIGEQSYKIGYTIQTKDLDLDVNQQMLYWNLLSNFETTTKHLSYSIEMPKAFDAKEVSTATGSYGEYGKGLTANVVGNKITGETTTPLRNNEAATIRVNLPAAYFTYPPQKDMSWYGIGAGVLCLAVSLLLFLKFGKDEELIIPVEFKAPEGLDSACVGYVIDNMVDNKDIISLIIDWANKGYIKIYDQETGFEIEKLRDFDDQSRGYDIVFFNALFKDNNRVSSEMLKNEDVRSALMTSKTRLRNYFNKSIKRRVYTQTSLSLQVFMIVLIMLPSILFTLLNGYAKYELMSIALPYVIPSVLLGLSCIPWIILMRKHYVMKRGIFTLSFGLLFMLNTSMIAISVWMQLLLDASLFASLLCGACQIGMIICMIYMDKRTHQGNRWLGEILGLRDFIMNCEKERLELLVNENPSAFYEILPYAYVLGVSDVWVKKFEHIIIPEPSWYDGYGYGLGNPFMTMLWWNRFHYCFHNISSAVTYVPPASSGSGGGSFGSGGFGGGGFSGGGFGGGGGGSW